MMQVFDLHNVKRKECYADKEYKIHKKLEEVILKCAMNNPLWQFIADKHNAYTDGFCGFEVRASNGEILGTIERSWSRHESAISIENDRIKEKRTRGTSYTTVSVDKALLQIKKTFAPMNVLEHMGKAKKKVDNAMDNLGDRANYDARSYERDINSEAYRWVLGTGFSSFLEYLQSDSPSRYKGVIEAIQKRAEYTDAFKEIKTTWDGISNGQSVMVVKEGSNYIVQYKGKVSVLDDNSLPEDWKANLGILKLVESNTIVRDRGCRIDETTFVIKVEEKE